MLYAPLMHLLSFTGWNHTYLTKEIYLSLKHISTESSKYHRITNKKITGDWTNFHYLWTLEYLYKTSVVRLFRGSEKTQKCFSTYTNDDNSSRLKCHFSNRNIQFFGLQGDVKKRQIGGKRKDRNKQRKKDFWKELMIFPLNTYMQGYNEWRRKY